MHEDATCNDLQKIITQAINEIKQEQGENFKLDKINLAELERRTGISRSRLRQLKENNFIVTPHGRTGRLSYCRRKVPVNRYLPVQQMAKPAPFQRQPEAKV